jgi:hypothetical protein
MNSHIVQKFYQHLCNNRKMSKRSLKQMAQANCYKEEQQPSKKQAKEQTKIQLPRHISPSMPQISPEARPSLNSPLTSLGDSPSTSLGNLPKQPALRSQNFQTCTRHVEFCVEIEVSKRKNLNGDSLLPPNELLDNPGLSFSF